jgi:hypothetical protein
MQKQPPAFLQCPKCLNLLDFSASQPDESRVICGKCGYDIGPYRDIKNAGDRAVQLTNLGPRGSATKH